jgi:hypothetical protein
MRMPNGLPGLTVSLAAVAFAPAAVAQHTAATPMTDEQMIASAMQAAPESIAKTATIVAIESDGKTRVLRKGTNDLFTCIPDNSESPGPDSMCGDRKAMEWAQAWIGHFGPQAMIDTPCCIPLLARGSPILLQNAVDEGRDRLQHRSSPLPIPALRGHRAGQRLPDHTPMHTELPGHSFDGADAELVLAAQLLEQLYFPSPVHTASPALSAGKTACLNKRGGPTFVSTLGRYLLAKSAQSAQSAPAQNGNAALLSLGPVSFHPGLTLTGAYTDNVYKASQEVGDWRSIIAPSLSIIAQGNPGVVQFSGNADLARYRRKTSENYDDGTLSAAGRLDLLKPFALTANASQQHSHISRGTINDPGAQTLTNQRTTSYGLGPALELGAWTLAFNYDYKAVDADNKAVAAGQIQRTSQDRSESYYKTRLTYAFSPVFKPYIAGLYNKIDYDFDPVTRTLLAPDRDSTGFEAAVGFALLPSSDITFTAQVGRFRQKYEDPSLRTVRGVNGVAQLTAKLSKQWSLQASWDRNFHEINLPGSPGYYDNSYIAGLSYAATPELTLTGQGTYSRLTVKQLPITVTEKIATLGASYAITPLLSLSTQFNIQDQQGRSPGLNLPLTYKEQVFSVSLTGRL